MEAGVPRRVLIADTVDMEVCVPRRHEIPGAQQRFDTTMHRGGGKHLVHVGGDAPEKLGAWEKQVLSARGFKRVGRHSEYAIYTVWRCVGRCPGGSRKRPRGFK
jgi:hypothetical protein